MESRQIEGLLEKYFDADTSQQEEQRLKQYFASGNVAPHLVEYAPMFNYFSSAQKETFTGKINYKPKKKSRLYSFIAVAASIMILKGVISHQSTVEADYGTYEDPELAMQKTKEALQMVSGLMNEGTDDLGYLQEFNNAKQKIVK